MLVGNVSTASVVQVANAQATGHALKMDVNVTVDISEVPASLIV